MDSIGVENWVIRLILVCIIFLATAIILRRFKGSNGRSWRELWQALTASLKRRIRNLLVVAGALFVISVLLPLIDLKPEVTKGVNIALDAGWIALSAWALTLLASAVVGLIQWRFDIGAADNLTARAVHTRVRVLQRIIVVLIWVAAIAGILLLFERFRVLGGTLLASAGVLSIAVGLSAQKTFGAVIAGIQMAFTRPINLDDVVIVEGEWGRIEEITFTYVVVKIWDQRRLVVPVSYFLETPFQNWTRKTSQLLGTVTLHVDYTAPLEPLREELKRLCEQSVPLWDGRTCALQVTEAGPETMTIRALVSADDASKAWDLRCMVREGLIDFLRQHHPHCLPKRRLEMQENTAQTE